LKGVVFMKHMLIVGTILGGLFTTLVPALAQVWTQTSAPRTNWSCVASSADGSRLVATVSGGLIYTSTNSGSTWTATSAPAMNWSSAASSFDGRTLVAASGYPYFPEGQIWVSTNSGTTWWMANAPIHTYYSGDWSCVACSADGSRLIASGADTYTSTNLGATWTEAIMPTPTNIGPWAIVGSSANGNQLVAAAQPQYTTPPDQYFVGGIYVSTNAGATWTQTSLPNSGYWFSVAFSADGNRLAAVGVALYFSTNSGATWRTNNVSWYPGCAASSADGTQLVVESQFSIWRSSDSGATWTDTANIGDGYSGYSLASSADGAKLVVAGPHRGIYTRQTTPTPTLTISPAGDGLVVSWVIPSMDFGLQQNPGLNPTNWTDVTAPVVPNLTNLQNQVTVSAPSGPMFYRLRSLGP
jgi:hypothetical protein